jgi:hypothetical protein
MQKAILTTVGLVFALACVGQNNSKYVDSLNYFLFRKYNLNIITGPYFSVVHAHSFQDNFWLFELKFMDRIRPFGLGKDGCLLMTGGIGFEPYQGTTATWGLAYEIFSKEWKVNASAGLQYAFGFSQVSSNDGQHFVTVGYHNYVVPNLNVVYWPFKVLAPRIQRPRFRELIFLKGQIAYSYLFTRLEVSATPGFDSYLFQAIQNHTGNTVLLMGGIGISIPSKREQWKLREKLYEIYRTSQL